MAVRSGAARSCRRRTDVLAGDDGGTPGRLAERALEQHRDCPIALIFPGDVWAPDAVALLRHALTPRGVVYADEDTIAPGGGHTDPRLKPDLSPDFLLSSSYVGRPLAIGAEVRDALRGLVGRGVAELEHECALRACGAAGSVVHISEVLCHRTGPGGDDAAPDGAAVRDELCRRGERAVVEPGVAGGTFAVRRRVRPGTSVSVLIPFRDEPRLLRACVESVAATTAHDEVEIVLIDNGSTEPETQTLLERLARRPEVQIVTDHRPFNWARLNNAAARLAGREILVFLNNDIEALRAGWLTALCAHALRPDIGAVGARLLYPNRLIQHCGVVVGMGGAAGHPLVGLHEDSPGYLHMAVTTRECAAVTGACLTTRREVFEALGGFDEALGVDLNDIDYCLRAGRLGYRTIYEPRAELIHHESPSRGTAGGVDDIVGFLDRWTQYIAHGDPYFNPHLTRIDPSCGLVQPGEEDSWNQWQATLAKR